MELLTNLTDYWQWLTFATVLIIVELFVGSVFFLWMGISAFLIGGLLYFDIKISWEWQLLIFSFLSIASIYIVKRFWCIKTDDNTLNARAKKLIGNVYEIASIDNGNAKVRVNDSWWIIRGCDNPSIGKQVKVVSIDSNALIVESHNNSK
ncbi:Putative activity regulator of membrane protease YbbK [uncultured Candidatus Thioglobus sp.]|nr:Putative activity regulator of membrane protease YbbK [uncultured Candidatus Thioglobus sp.]